MSIPRGLSAEEADAWARLAESVTPFEGRDHPARQEAVPPRPSKKPEPRERVKTSSRPVVRTKEQRPPLAASGLDSHWDRRLKAGVLQPEITIDLHGLGLDGAYQRLMGGVEQARAIGARSVLLITGKPRPVDPADRGTRRGAIRAKVLDWLAASSHHQAIAAIRTAHRRHGGDGALYIVLKRQA